MNFSLLSRIVGGAAAQKNEHPWMASLKENGRHFCGACIVSERHIITAAHCVKNRNETRLMVCVGDHDFTKTEDSQKMYSVKTVIIHPKFIAEKPINYDVAILILHESITLNNQIQPACLPNPEDHFPTGSLCIALGWGRLRERGPLPNTLHKVTLPVFDYQKCISVMDLLTTQVKFDTVVCAGFPDGGKDACQGDSGGPYLCQRHHGGWVLVGVTSWGMGCARPWKNNWMLPPNQKGSPGIFTDIKRLHEWVFAQLDYGGLAQPNLVKCSVEEGVLKLTAGLIQVPNNPRGFYSNNEKCTWTIVVPQGKDILLSFSRFDLEDDLDCDLDYLAIYSTKDNLIGKFCGSNRPRPILITNSSVTVKFFSDFRDFRTGFAMSFQAVEPQAYPGSECGSVAAIFDEGEIQTMNHPKEYNSDSECTWVMHCAPKFKIQVEFLMFDVEPHKDCVFDYVIIYYDLAGTVVAGKFCGAVLPPKIVSTSNVLQIVFSSDSFVNHIGFKAIISFVFADADVGPPEQKVGYNPFSRIQSRVLDSDTGCMSAPIEPKFFDQGIARAGRTFQNSWPWHGSINFLNKHLCSGTVVSERFVLTSASCVAEKEKFQDTLQVVAGVHDLEQSENTQKRSVSAIIKHPGFDPSYKYNDLALIKLNKPLRFNDYVQPVCFPKSYSNMEPGLICVVTGWHLSGEEKNSTKLQQLEAPLISDGNCKKYYSDISHSMFCAGAEEGQANETSLEQSGSPLVCPSSNMRSYFLYGIVSAGFSCSKNAKPGLCTKISLFTKWIQEHTKEATDDKSAEKHIYRTSKEEGYQFTSTEEEPDYNSNSREWPYQTDQRGMGRHKDVEDNYPLTSTEEEDRFDQISKSYKQPPQQASTPSKDNASEFIHIECKDVVSLRSPGKIKLFASSRGNPEGFSCQIKVQAPEDHFIVLKITALNTSNEQNSLLVYEGVSSDNPEKAPLSVDRVPDTINSTGSTLTLEAKTTIANSQLQLCFSYTFHIVK
ncbi:ovochymase-2-like isoform X2 [Hyperolius riggenbachi]|uniref:ovochymase-2-like isoform X2 n=1 Tax=Hyperolius riggenbachi TaxID=752182 RepID=UPI0035A2A111